MQSTQSVTVAIIFAVSIDTVSNPDTFFLTIFIIFLFVYIRLVYKHTGWLYNLFSFQSTMPVTPTQQGVANRFEKV